MNLEELVRAALAEEASAEPDEASAYDRFLQHRRRGALLVAASTGLAVALWSWQLAVGGAPGRGRGGSGGRPCRPLRAAPTTAGTPASTRPSGPIQTTLARPAVRARLPGPGWSAGSARGSS